MNIIIQTDAMYAASLAGGVAFALSGFLVGARNNLDWMGLFIMSFLTANGGGILRDLLTDRPLVILSGNEPFLIVFLVTLIGSILKLQHNSTIETKWFFVLCDAVGLVAFAITGSLVALEIKAPFFGFITLAFLTAAGGAILRDLLVNQIPDVLHSGFYGSVAVLVAIVIYILNMMELLNNLTLFLVFTISLGLRLFAYQYNWKLPKL